MTIANAICDQSGGKVKLRRLRKQWDGAMVLPEWLDERPKQLQVPSVRENPFMPIMRPEQPSIFNAANLSNVLQQMRNNGIPT